MTYYKDKKNVRQYIQMAEGYDGKELIARLREHTPPEATVLELGMGPGKDLLLLAQHYKVTGSDSSTVFLDLFKEQHPTTDLLQLDALTLETDRRFDAIYSNKVLHHLNAEQLRSSFEKQVAIMTTGGIVLHSFWYGTGVEHMQGLQHAYYTEATLAETFPAELEMLEMQRYAEMEEGDSITSF